MLSTVGQMLSKEKSPFKRPLCSRMSGYIASKRIRRELMEKYGVELDPNQPKIASDGTRQNCPMCGRELDKVDGVYIKKCPIHGTEPFEASK